MRGGRWSLSPSSGSATSDTSQHPQSQQYPQLAQWCSPESHTAAGQPSCPKRETQVRSPLLQLPHHAPWPKITVSVEMVISLTQAHSSLQRGAVPRCRSSLLLTMGQARWSVAPSQKQRIDSAEIRTRSQRPRFVYQGKSRYTLVNADQIMIKALG